MVFTKIYYKKNNVSRETFTFELQTENRAIAIWYFNNKFKYQFIITDIIHFIN